MTAFGEMFEAPMSLPTPHWFARFELHRDGDPPGNHFSPVYDMYSAGDIATLNKCIKDGYRVAEVTIIGCIYPREG